jgi:hypothetical protein
MTRYKWFRVGLPSTFQRFTKKLRSTSMAQGSLFGFTQIGGSEDRSRFRYLRRVKVSLSSIDAAGNSSFQVVDSVESVEFELFQTGAITWLRVDSPPRSLLDLTSGIENVSGMGFSIEPVVFGYREQRALLKRADSHRMVGFKGLGHDVSAKLIARVEVASKEGVEPDRLEFLKSLQYKIDHTTFDVSFRMLKGQITFTASGLVRIGGALEPYLLDCVEDCLSV